MADGGKIERAKTKCRDGIKAVRDRRRRVRQRLEQIFGRKQFTSVAVIGAMGKLIETSVVPLLDPQTGVDWSRVAAWAVVFGFALVASLYWEILAQYAEAAGDAVEEKVEDATESN